MLIKHVKIQNWKNFKQANFPIYERLFIIGPNASGKSNLLDVLRFLSDISTQGLKEAARKRGGLSSFRCLGAKQYSDIVIDVTLEDNDGIWNYFLSLTQDSASNPILRRETVTLNGEEIFTRPNSQDEGDKAQLRQTGLEQYHYNTDFRKISQFFETVNYQHIIPQVVRDPSGFTPAFPITNDPYGRDFLLRIAKSPIKTRESRLKKITAALKSVVPQLEYLEIKLEAGRPHLIAGWKHWRKSAAGQSEEQLSDGTLRLLGLLWSFFEGSGPLLIEEPELSLHPEVVKLIPQLLFKLNSSRKEPRQYFISTHSRELLSDPGIHPTEIIRLSPGVHGTEILETSVEDTKAMVNDHLSAADVLLPRTKPKNTDQLVFAFD